MSPKRILIIDDEAVLTRLMRVALERTGKYEVRTENRSVLALEAAKEFKPDLVILDLIMPELDGGDVLEALRKETEFEKIPVIFLTASVRKSGIDAHGGSCGGYVFMEKPASPSEILECIGHQLSD